MDIVAQFKNSKLRGAKGIMTWVGDTYKHCGVKRNTTQIGLKYLNQFKLN